MTDTENTTTTEAVVVDEVQQAEESEVVEVTETFAPEEVLVDIPKVEGEKHLQCPWSFWYDKKPSRGSFSSSDPQHSAAVYNAALHKLGSFNSVEGFYRFYCQLIRPSEMPKNTNVHIFRNATKPMWENFPDGGCWMLKIRKKCPATNALWEKLVISMIGEIFEEPDVVGAVCSIRSKEDILSVWCKCKHTTPEGNAIRFRIGDKLRNLFQLDSNTLLEYKALASALRDGSSHRNGKAFLCGLTPPAPQPQKRTAEESTSDGAQGDSGEEGKQLFTDEKEDA